MVVSELRAAVVVALRERPGRLEDVAAQLVEEWSDEFVRGALAWLLPGFMRRVANGEGIRRGALGRRAGGLSDRLCECGCGERTKISARTKREKGWVRGEPRRFVAGHAGALSVDQWLVDPVSGCWVWQRAVKKGYGSVQEGGRRLRAHRWVYEREVGVSLAGLDLHHVCENKLCVNPAHLSPLTKAEHGRVHASRR